MKILHVTPCYKPAYIYGGITESISRLCTAMAQSGHSVYVFTTTANGNRELPVVAGKEHDVDGVKVTYFRRLTKDPTHVSPALWKHLWRDCHRFDAVHIHSWWNVLAMMAAWICILNNVKIIISPRGMLCSYIFNSTHVRTKKWIHRIVGRRVLSKSVFHATAQSEYDECTQLIKGWRGFMLPNLLQLSECVITRTVNPHFAIIFLSRIHPKKGIELLLKAIVDLPFAIKLKIAGTGESEYIGELKRQVESLGIIEKVEWLGWINRDEKFIELMQSDCMVLTSYNENFANVVIESLHVGTPVLISENVGVADFVRKENAGWITGLNAGEIRQTIIQAFEDRSTREYVNRNGRQIVEKCFCQAELIRQYIENYQKMGYNHRSGN